MKKIRANLFITPITLLIGAIVALVLYFTKCPWVYYLIGVMAGLLSHGLFMRMNSSLAKKMELDPEGKVFNPKKDAMLNAILRMILVIAVFASAIAKTMTSNRDNALWDILCCTFGYLTFRAVMILCFIFIKDKEDDNR